MLANIPMQRFGELDDLVGASVFLCSDAARYITGGRNLGEPSPLPAPAAPERERTRSETLSASVRPL